MCNNSNKSNNSNKTSLREDLQTLIIKQNVQHNTANQLLQILRKHVEWPNDVKFLVHTPRNASANIQIFNVWVMVIIYISVCGLLYDDP